MTARLRPRPAGFTLVEVMVALLIFGMLSAAGVALLSFGVRAQGATARRLDDVSAMVRLASVLSADLAQANDRPTRDEGGLPLPAFTGDAAGLQIVRGGWTNFDRMARPSEQKVAWRFDGQGLSRTAWPMLDGARPLDPATMLNGIRLSRFRYRVAGAWSDRWDGATGPALPQAVELRIVRADGAEFRHLFLVGTGYAAQPAGPPRIAPGA